MKFHNVLSAIFPQFPKRATVDLQEWRDIPPGTVKTLEDKSGHRWALMHEDDFEHILALAKLQMKRIPETVKEGRSDG